MLMTLHECISDVTLIICINIKHMALENEQAAAVPCGIDACVTSQCDAEGGRVNQFFLSPSFSTDAYLSNYSFLYPFLHNSVQLMD